MRFLPRPRSLGLYLSGSSLDPHRPLPHRVSKRTLLQSIAPAHARHRLLQAEALTRPAWGTHRRRTMSMVGRGAQAGTVGTWPCGLSRAGSVRGREQMSRRWSSMGASIVRGVTRRRGRTLRATREGRFRRTKLCLLDGTRSTGKDMTALGSFTITARNSRADLCSSRLFFVGYTSGLQVWDCTDLSTVSEVLNLSADWGRVIHAGVLPDPQSAASDPFASERPLIGIVYAFSFQSCWFTTHFHSVRRTTTWARSLFIRLLPIASFGL